MELFPMEVTLTTDDVSPPGIRENSPIVDVFTPPLGPTQPNSWQAKSDYHQVPERPQPALLWQGDPFIHPRGIMLDPDEQTLWISDPGEAELDPINKPCRIIRVPIVNGKPGTPSLFYKSPGFLWSAKWCLPVILNGQKVLIVADQGEPTSEYTFTGRGAKVFLLPVLSNNTAGTPQILWEGLPFVCPTGVALVNNIIYITDPCAGPLRQDPHNPGYSFPTSKFFAMQTAPGIAPTVLFSGEPFTSLIGICALDSNQLILSDTDSGRPDGGQTGRPGFSPPRSADRWIVQILDPNQPVVSQPKRSAWTEQGDIKINFKTIQNAINLGIVNPNDSLIIKGSKGTKIITDQGPVDSIFVQINKMDSAQIDTLWYKYKRLVIANDIMSDSIGFNIRVNSTIISSNNLLAATQKSYGCSPSLPKNSNRGNLFSDNKHGGRTKPILTRSSSSPTLIRYTLDNKLGHGSIWIYPDAGGSPKVLAIGPPLARPLGGQLSPDNKTLWFTDQHTGSLYSIPFPTIEEFKNIYGLK